jgi:tetratricopeptide (TPR) repeat protein
VKSWYSLVFSLMIFVAQGQTDERLARQYFENGEYEKAVRLFETVYEKSDADKNYKALLDCYIQLEDYKSGLKLVQKHQKRRKQQPVSYLVDEIQLHRLLDDEKSIVKASQQLLKLVSQAPTLAFQVSKQCSDIGLFNLGLEVLDVAEAADSRLSFHFQKALLYAELGQLENMYGAYLELIDQNPSYVRYVQSLIQRNMEQDGHANSGAAIKPMLIKKVQEGQNIVYNELLIWILTQEKDFQGAFVQLRALDKRLNRNQAELFELGVTCRQNGAWKTAYQIFDYILEKGRNSPFYIDARLEKAYTKMDEVLEAETPAIEPLIADFEALLKVLGKNDETIELIQKLAHIHAFYRHDHQTAISLLEEALKISGATPKELASIKLELGDILLLEGDYYDAILLYAQVEKGLPDTDIGQEAKFRKARVAYFQGDFEWAKAQFDVLKESTSKLISNDAIRMSLLIGDHSALDTSFAALEHYASADLLHYRGLYQDAISALDMMAGIYSKHNIMDHVLFLKAKSHIQLQAFAEATGVFEKLVSEYPESVLADQALFRMAMLFETKLNDIEQARKYYENLLEKHPDSILTAEARRRYRTLRGDFL